MRVDRRKIFVLASNWLFICFVVSCSLFGDGGGLAGIFVDSSTDDWSGGTEYWTYDGSQVQYELPSGVRTLEIEAGQAVDIFMVKMNSSAQVLPARSTRYIVSASRASAAGRAAGVVDLDSLSAGSAEIGLLQDVSGVAPSGVVRKDFAPARDFVPSVVGKGGGAGRSAETAPLLSVVGESQKSVVPLNAVVNSTTKSLWVDVPSNRGIGVQDTKITGGTTYTKRSATLQYNGSSCYVWLISNDGSGLAVTDKIQGLGQKFDDMYQKIRDVFGQESDKMIDWQNQRESIVDISSVSDTGTKVNIVVYDIGGDYKSGQQAGVVGYFWAKDYYTAAAATASGDAVIGLTNGGKYFYVDSGFLKDHEQVLYSTLAHEFQHMINFGEKTMASMETAKYQSQVLVSQTWSNEMMSMLCEDMIQQYLQISDENSPVSRLSAFVQGYYRSGLTDWLDGDYVIFSYAGVYAFGAYLARNYGGSDLIKQIATNDYVDQQAVSQALKTVGRNETFDSVFKKYAQALVLDNPPSGANVPSFNKEVSGIGGKNMKAIDIFNLKVQDESGKTHVLRPGLMGSDADNRVDLRPYGFTLNTVGYTESAGTVRLTFSSPVNESERIYVLVQPRKS